MSNPVAGYSEVRWSFPLQLPLDPNRLHQHPRPSVLLDCARHCPLHLIFLVHRLVCLPASSRLGSVPVESSPSGFFRRRPATFRLSSCYDAVWLMLTMSMRMICSQTCTCYLIEASSALS